MDIGSIFLILALLVGVILFITRPLFDGQSYRSSAQGASIPDFGMTSAEHERSALLAERDRVLNALQELDFDYALGKIPEEDYPQQRKRLLAYGTEVLRKLDELDGKLPTSQAQELEEIEEKRIEAVVAARRLDAARPRPAINGGKVVPASVAAPDDQLEVMLANRRRALRNEGNQQNSPAGFCSKCGAALHRADKFCPRCGAKIS